MKNLILHPLRQATDSKVRASSDVRQRDLFAAHGDSSYRPRNVGRLVPRFLTARQALYDIAANPKVWDRDAMIETAMQAEFAARAALARTEASK